MKAIMICLLLILISSSISFQEIEKTNSQKHTSMQFLNTLGPIHPEPDNDFTGASLTTRSTRYLEDIISLDSGTVQLTVISGDAYDNNYGNIGGGTPLSTGDIDNDGFEDMMIGCPFADGLNENIGNAGHVMVIFGGNQTHPYTVYDQAKNNPDKIDLVIHGGGGSDLLGYATTCGDIDGDGFDDMIIAAPWGDSKNNGRTNAGEVYVFYGRPRNEFSNNINLRTTAPDLMILGAWGGGWPNYELAGYSVAVGNVMGDSRGDILIGAIYSNPAGRTNAGRVYIIKGDTRGNLGNEIDLRTGADVTIIGAKSGDIAGNSVAAGDVNGDGRDDIVIGSYLANIVVGQDAGKTYLIYGKQTLSSTIDLNTSADTIINGAGFRDYSGYKVAVGNINGDSYNDIFVSAPWGDGPNNALRNCGEVYVIYGSATIPATINTATNGQNIIIYGENQDDVFGYSLATGNVNNDKYDDVLIGATLGDGLQNGASNAGEAYLILGNSTASLGNNIDPMTKSKSIFYGIDANDRAGRFVEFGDFDGDSNNDILIGAPYAQGPDDGRDASGEFYVIYGAPPPVKNEFLELIDGDIDNRTILSRYKPYTFCVNTSNILDYRDTKSVTLTLNPLGYDLAFRWSKSTNDFNQISGPLDLVDCISTSADARHDSFYNYTIDFKFIFNWDFSKDYSISCRVLTEGKKSLPAENIYPSVFTVINKLYLNGALQVEGAFQGMLKDKDWVSGSEEITFSGVTVVYEGAKEYYPPVSEYSLGIEDNVDITMIEPQEPGELISVSIKTPKMTVDYDYKFKILDIPEGSDNSSVGITLKIDNDPPVPPNLIEVMADSFNETEQAAVDNDQEVYITWDPAIDKGSGTAGYYYSFKNHGGTKNGFWTENTSAQLANATEGLKTIYVWARDKVGNIGLANTCQIFIDLSKITFENFTPTYDTWLTSKNINCTFSVCDRGGFGVDPGSIEYWSLQTQSWQPITVPVDPDSGNLSCINITLQIRLIEGTKSFVQFLAYDLAGNGPTLSETYKFKIDSTPVTFFNVKPDPAKKQASTRVKCYITVRDLGGSGVNLSSIQYSYTSSGENNFTDWGDSGLAMVANTQNAEELSTWFIDLTFSRGSENYIRWRAMDLARNGYTISETFTVLINELPVIVINETLPDSVIKSSSEIELSAKDSYDVDNKIGDLVFSWRSNISGELGNDRVIKTKLPAGLHLINITIYDGLNNASYEFNIKVEDDRPPREEAGTFFEEENTDLLITSFVIFVIIIILIFLVIFSREIKKRKELEEKAKSHETSYVPPHPGQTPQLVGSGGEISVLGSVGKGPAILEADMLTAEPSPFGATEARETLPRVGATAVGGAGNVVVPGVTPHAPSAAGGVAGAGAAAGTVGRELPQLPPAEAAASSAGAGTYRVQPSPEIIAQAIDEADLSAKEKLELLEKKMLLNKISVELYTKLSKRYEQELSQRSKPPSSGPKVQLPKTPGPQSTPGTSTSTSIDTAPFFGEQLKLEELAPEPKPAPSPKPKETPPAVTLPTTHTSTSTPKPKPTTASTSSPTVMPKVKAAATTAKIDTDAGKYKDLKRSGSIAPTSTPVQAPTITPTKAQIQQMPKPEPRRAPASETKKAKGKRK